MAESDGLAVQRALLVSDLHLLGDPGGAQEHFLSFLRRRVAGDPESALVIAGDLFHFWFGFPDEIPAPYREVVGQLERLPRVIWVEGNHDIRIARALGSGSRLEVHPRSVRLLCGSDTIHVEHGDVVDQRSLGQRALRRILRSGLADAAAWALGSERTQRLGHHLAGELVAEGYDGGDGAWLLSARRSALRRQREGTALTVLGHGHVLGWWSEGLVCLGDWLHHRSYLEIGAAGSRLFRYEPLESEDSLLAESPSGEIPR